ncbi:MAG: hypothetical protein A3B44_03120 [Candidatus Levybacteria bacterium RIFCSPLOWO2_01_FULL_38_21]|nr:MAG: hypothetical protein A3B44_03120 [Candidatus Levybacteria bacterium RIFCSPLOWO2_01_FULL_38_21]
MRDYLQNKVILITGSSGGIGSATATLASESGAKVILHGNTNSKKLEGLARKLKADFIACDVTNKSSVIKEVKRIVEKTKKIEGLINCAGIVRPKPFLETEDENWLEEYKVNFLGTVHFCQAVIPYMLKNKYGRIVNIASIRGHSATSTPRGMSYSASKAAIVNLTAALAKEYAPNIAVNAVSPGFVQTEMSKTWNETVWNQAKSSLLKRTAQPSEIGEALLFLISGKASFITGQTILVDGGYTISGK